MSDPIVRPLALDDLDDALRLSTVAGWNQRTDDWRMLLRLAPAGAFAAVLDARVVGTSTRTVEREWRSARAWLYTRLAVDADEAGA